MELTSLTIIQLIIASVSLIFALFIFLIYVLFKNAKKNQCKLNNIIAYSYIDGLILLGLIVLDMFITLHFMI